RAGTARRDRLPLSAGSCATWLGALATVDLLSCGREHPPRSAELVDALTGRLARLPVGDEVVERVTVVGHLELAVLPLGRAEQRGADARTGDGFSLGDERRPESGARPVAGAGRALVLNKVVERDPLAVDEDASQARLRNHDPGSARLRNAGRGKRRGGQGDHH